MSSVYQPQDVLWLWWLGSPPAARLVGELRLARGGRAVSLEYAPPWLASGFPLSEDLPLRAGLYLPAENDLAAGAVDDARPDRWGERVIRKFEKSPRLSLLEFLLFAGDDRYGALGVSRSAAEYLPWHASPVPGLGDLDAMAEVVRKVLANEPVREIERRLVRPGVSLGGARPKSVIAIDGHPWLVKFSEGEDLDMELLEHATMTLAARCGIEVAPTRALPVAGRHAVAVRRFDRTPGRRIHAVSAAVALRAAGEPFGYPQLAQLLRRLAPARAIAPQQGQLFRRMVFNILLDNTDDHEKNHALLRQDDGHYLLSPAFDIVPGAHGLGYQSMLVGEAGAESTLPNALSQAAAFGLKQRTAASIMSEVARVVAGWKQHFRRQGLRDAEIDLLSNYVDGDRLRAQREAFTGKPRSRARAKNG